MSAVKKLIGDECFWTTDKRLDQSRALRARKIWLKSTGPRTPEGKAKSSLNARKEGYEHRQMLCEQRRQRKRVANYVSLHRLFLDIYTSNGIHWDKLTAQAQAAIIQELRVLQNELSILARDIHSAMEKTSNILPFPERPPN